jgi:hypothetical protein
VFFGQPGRASFEADEMPPEALADNLILGRMPEGAAEATPTRPSDPLTNPPGPSTDPDEPLGRRISRRTTRRSGF